MRLAERLFSPPVRTAEMDPREPTEPLFAPEEAAISGALPKRRREFAAGRTCARRAIAQLGEPPAAILAGEDRAPCWPPGVVGSITHSAEWCAAAVARTADGVRAIGIDVEPAAPIEDSLLRIICLAEERESLLRWPANERGVLARLIFSAKECAYKCQYPLTRKFLGFHAMEIRLGVAQGSFTALFRQDAPPFVAGDALQGRLLVEGGYLMTAMVLEGDSVSPPARSDQASA